MLLQQIIATALTAAAITITTACAGSGAPATTEAQADNNTEAVIDNIMTRTSIRQFTNDTIGSDTIESILKAGMAAPTAVNKQPWAFVVVTDRAMLDSLDAAHPHARLQTATAAIVVCGDMQKTLDDKAREYWIQDCSAATENILLAAHAYGLGAVWCGVYPMADRIQPVSDLLGLPSTIIPLNIICLGHPAEAPAPKDKWDPANIHYQRW